jgi:Ca-activated chloride channel family protein
MSFAAPGWLLLLLAPLALVVTYVVLQARRPDYAVRFTNLELLDRVAPKRPGWRRHVTAAVFLVALFGLVVAAARPERDVKVPRERATVMMAIDTSLSMTATDVPPNRLDAAQVAANRFVDALPPTINLGLVTFNGTATVQVPPTTDRALVRRAIDNMELGEGTSMSQAIDASLSAIDNVPIDGADEPVPARIVLMSDGASTLPEPDPAAADAAAAADAFDAGVPISTIAFGTLDATISLEEPVTTIVPVPVEEEALREIADRTGGTFFTASSEEELSSVFDDIGSSVGFETEKREITPWFVGAALILFLTAAVLSLIWFARLP